MSGFKFTLDGNVVTPPKGFDKFTEEIVRDDENRHLYFNFPAELLFYGDGYDYIDSIYKIDYNRTISITVFDERSEFPVKIIEAIIKISECNFNLTEKTVILNIDDSSYQSDIFSNLKTKVLPSVSKSKNGDPMTGASVLDLNIYNPNTGTNITGVRMAFDLKDCFTALINFMTNGVVSFESTWYDSLGETEKIAVMTGAAFRQEDAKREPEISIQTLLDEAWKKFNLYLIVESPLYNPVVRLEVEGYLFDNPDSIQINDIKDLERQLDLDKLYSSVTLGSNKYLRAYANEYLLPYFQFFGFSEENYNISGVAGIENNLDLRSDYIIDTNVLEDIITNNTTTYDDSIFFIQYTTSTVTATRCEYYDHGVSGGYLYNEIFLNSRVAQRFQLYGDLVLSSGIQDINFQASRTTEEQNSLVVGDNFNTAGDFINYDFYPYDDDSTLPNFDDNEVYDNTTFEYEADTNGVYRFSAGLRLMLTSLTPFSGATNGNFVQLVSIGFLVNGTDEYYPGLYYITNDEGNGYTSDQMTSTYVRNVSSTGTLNLGINYRAERTIDLLAGDTVSVQIKVRVTCFQGENWFYTLNFSGNIFKTIVTPDTGGVFQPADPDSVQIGSYVKKGVEIPLADWILFKQEPTRKLILNTGNNDNRFTHVKRISRNFETGESDIQTTFNRLQPHI